MKRSIKAKARCVDRGTNQPWAVRDECPVARANQVHDAVKRFQLVNSLFSVQLMTIYAPKRHVADSVQEARVDEIRSVFNFVE